jgi:hypothetical protein
MMPPNFQLIPNMNLMSHLMTAKSNPNVFPNYSASQMPNMMNKLNEQQAHVANALMNPQFNPALLEYFQSKASQSFQQNYLNNTFNNNHHQQHQSNPHQLAQQHSQYPDDYKKSFTGFNSTFHDHQMHQNYTGQQHSNFNTDLMRNYNYLNVNNNKFNMNGQNQDVQQNFSSSSCSSNDSSGLESLKETQLRISESCNLVNESS